MTIILSCAIAILGMGSGWPGHISQWKPQIDSVAKKECVDPNLIAAIILAESGGDSKIIAPDGGVGLMQIMPSDNQRRPDLQFSWAPQTSWLLVPENNIRHGVMIIKTVMARRNNDIRFTLASYNCGEKGVLAGKCGSVGGYAYADKVLAYYFQYGEAMTYLP